MSRLTYLCMGACTLLLLVFGFFWTPGSILAATGEPQGGYGGKSCPTIHKIVLGENLTVIAAKYEVSVEALVEENGIEDANLIVENQALCIPTKTRGSLNEWGSYGVPGQSYDPSTMNKQGGYGPQGGSYGPQQNSYGPQQNSYGPQENSYGNQPVKPGQSYDPSLYGNQGNWKPETSYDVPGKADTSYGPYSKQEGYWKDEKGYPRGGAFFPEYTPNNNEPDPTPTPTPTPTATPPNGNEEEEEID